MARFEKPPRAWPALLAGYPESIGSLAVALDETVRRAEPALTSSVRGARMMGYVNYELPGVAGVLLRLSPEDDHVKLYVHHIREDATGMLAVEGTGTRARHVKFRETPDAAAVAALIQQEIQAARGSAG